ncbi:efflux RND transporter periplasmic adaptor subunit [Alteromonadaceae bacterium BrNp21-10]|nr:efflux RND transporter periplasmic adaptor subunit [Alteromonadaceae bacterium BrNp21-10]
MSTRTKITPILFAVILIAALVAYLYMPVDQAEEVRQSQSTPVVLHKVNETEFRVLVEALGTTIANEAVNITAQSSDVVDQILFDDGQIVEAGQVLLTLNSREERARVNELEINLAEAHRQYKRLKNLAKENMASAQLLDEQEAKVKALKAQREIANTKLAELEVRAPFAGKLGIRQISLGALVTPGMSITTLDDLHQVKVDFSISEAHLSSISLEQSIAAKSIAWPDELFKGRVKSIDSRMDPITRAIKVRAVIDNPDYKLRPGMLLQIDLQKQVLQTLVVPESALIPIQEKQFVFVVSADNISERREVITGHRIPGQVQIISGLTAGERVVKEGGLRLKNGGQVSVLSVEE